MTVTPFGGWCLRALVIHGFADSPVALFRHPLRGLGSSPEGWYPSPRVGILRRGLVSFASVTTTGSRTHPWLCSVTPFGGLVVRPGVGACRRWSATGSRTHPWLYSATRFAGCVTHPYS